MCWKYKIKTGVALREAINNEDMEQVVKCLLSCYQELSEKLTAEDKEDYEDDIEDVLDELSSYEPYDDDEENDDYINGVLSDFYDLCDSLGAWICTINDEV